MIKGYLFAQRESIRDDAVTLLKGQAEVNATAGYLKDRKYWANYCSAW